MHQIKICHNTETCMLLKSTGFWDVTPCSPVEVYRQANNHPEGSGKLRSFADALSLVTFLSYSSTLKRGSICSSETVVDLYQDYTAPHLHSRVSENLRSEMI
jgi:hypothetical protein